MSSTHSVDYQIINEISLENIVKVSYDEQILDKNFTLICQILQELRQGLREGKIKSDLQTQEIKSENITNNEQNQQLNAMMKDFNSFKEEMSKSGDVMQEIKEIQETLHKVQDKAHVGMEKSIKNEKDISWILDELNKIQNKMKEIEMKSEFLVKKSDYDDQVSDMERQVDGIEQQIENIKIEDLEKNLKVLEEEEGMEYNPDVQEQKRWATQDLLEKTQTNIENLLKELNNLKNQLQQLQSSKSAGKNGSNSVNRSMDRRMSVENPEDEWSASERDFKLGQDLLERLQMLEDALFQLKAAYQTFLLKLQSDQVSIVKGGGSGINNDDFEKLRQDVIKIQSEFKKFGENFEKTKETLNDHDQAIAELKKMIEGTNNQLMKIATAGFGAGGGAGGINDDQLNNRLNNLRNEILTQLQNFKKECADQYLTMERLNEELLQIAQIFADKQDTKKGLNLLDKQIAQIQSLVMLLLNEGSTEDDARGAKQQLNWTCLSCDKDIPRYKAKIGDYRPWSQLPSRYHSPDKLANLGQGSVKLQSLKSPATSQKSNDPQMPHEM